MTARQFVKPAIAENPDVYLPGAALNKMALAMPRSAEIARLQKQL
ncbi:hypothetical protein [Burkholderia sp. Bp8998]|nr:hypothetical protein [Burkholderia sp. Bp8998]